MKQPEYVIKILFREEIYKYSSEKLYFIFLKREHYFSEKSPYIKFLESKNLYPFVHIVLEEPGFSNGKHEALDMAAFHGWFAPLDYSTKWVERYKEAPWEDIPERAQMRIILFLNKPLNPVCNDGGYSNLEDTHHVLWYPKAVLE